MTLEQKAFQEKITLLNDGMPYTGVRRPMMIASSGGGGHIVAIKGLISYLMKRFKHIEFLDYHPGSPPLRSNPSAKHIRIGSRLTNSEGCITSYISSVFIQPLLNRTAIPILPTETEIDEEISTLISFNKRQYIDMLLDVYPAGYECAAIWNVQQKNGRIKELKKMIPYQPSKDRENETIVKSYFHEKLDNAYLSGKPYTDIISTQAMSLPALCEAVHLYNSKHAGDAIPKLLIHQYLTDLPSKGATHFFEPINRIERQHRENMMLYGVQFDSDILRSLLDHADEFKNIYEIASKDNPLVRPGFKEREVSLHDYLNMDCAVQYKAYTYQNNTPQSLNKLNTVNIYKYEKTASILLGSQTNIDTPQYVDSFLTMGYENIFVFGGYSTGIYSKIDAVLSRQAISIYKEHQQSLLKENKAADTPTAYLEQGCLSLQKIKASLKKRIILLGRQEDIEMHAILSRSNTIIMRSGGLSVMEQMAITHCHHQAVFIHHADSAKNNNEMTSGIEWEDQNANGLMQFLRAQGLVAKKTSPSRFLRDLEDTKTLHHFMSYVTQFNNKLNNALSVLQDENVEQLMFYLETMPSNMHKNKFVIQILSNLNRLKALNIFSSATSIPLTYDVIDTLVHNEEMINRIITAQDDLCLILHLLNEPSKKQVNVISPNGFVNDTQCFV